MERERERELERAKERELELERERKEEWEREREREREIEERRSLSSALDFRSGLQEYQQNEYVSVQTHVYTQAFPPTQAQNQASRSAFHPVNNPLSQDNQGYTPRSYTPTEASREMSWNTHTHTHAHTHTHTHTQYTLTHTRNTSPHCPPSLRHVHISITVLEGSSLQGRPPGS